MTRTVFLSTMAGALLFATAAIGAASGEFDNMCAEGLALGKDVKTDCTVSETIDGKIYCFGNETAKTLFMKDPQGNLAKAQTYYSSKH
jgi:YHS domain-containing protein